MKRREAIKSITLTSGAIVSSGTLLSLLQSCTAKEATWQPLFFSSKEGKVLSALCDTIFPKDDWPSASEVNVPQYIDLLYKDVFDPMDGNKIKKGLSLFDEVFDGQYGDSFGEANYEDRTAGLSEYFNISGKEASDIRRLVENKTDDKSSDKYFIYSFLTKVREITISAYYQTEDIGKNYLPYDPIPSEWRGCMDLSEVGKNWSPSL